MKRAWWGRRRALRVLGGAGAALIARHATGQGAGARSRAMPACVLTPEQTEGPYFVDERLERSDVRSDPADTSVRPGAVLSLDLRILAAGTRRCDPPSGAIGGILPCDAAGGYSHAHDRASRPPGG